MTKSILLHTCCGPCATAVIPYIASANSARFADQNEGQNDRPVLYFYNPNIHPHKEYLERLRALKVVALANDVEIIEADYDQQAWDEAVVSYAGVFPLIKGAADYEKNLEARALRCTACYKLRFENTARCASLEGFTSIGTTLSISPHQFTEVMREILSRICDAWQLRSAFEDYRHLYNESIHWSKLLGLYRQNYCGCKYSLSEAEIERAHRAKIRLIAHPEAQREIHKKPEHEVEQP